jgi:hypothetical protein
MSKHKFDDRAKVNARTRSLKSEFAAADDALFAAAKRSKIAPAIAERMSTEDFVAARRFALSDAALLPTESAARKAVPLASGCLDYFPDALAAVAQVSYEGNKKHNPGQPLHWDKAKSTDEADCLLRHFAERGTWDDSDTAGGAPQRHSAKVAWRALALLQREIDAARAAGLPAQASDLKIPPR